MLLQTPRAARVRERAPGAAGLRAREGWCSSLLAGAASSWR